MGTKIKKEEGRLSGSHLSFNLFLLFNMGVLVEPHCPPIWVVGLETPRLVSSPVPHIVSLLGFTGG